MTWKPDETAYQLYELIAELPHPERGYDATMIAKDARMTRNKVRGRLKTMVKHGMIEEHTENRRKTYWPAQEDVMY